MKKIYKNIKITLIAALTMFSFSTCNEELTTKSSTDVSGDVVLSNTAGIEMLLRSAYNYLMYGDKHAGGQETGAYVGMGGWHMYFDNSGEDVMATGNYGMSPVYCYDFDPTRTNADGNFANKIWRQYYIVVNEANLIIDALPNATGTDAEKTALRGQALAMRAISNFYLVMCYQQSYCVAKDKRGIILRTSSTDPIDKDFSTVAEVYNQIVADLQEAKSALSNFSRSEKWQINADVAQGILARVYQVMGNWEGALSEASALYSKYNTLMTKEEWCGGFDDIDVPESIWGIVNTNLSNGWENCHFNYWYNYDPSYGEGQTDGPIYCYLELFVSDTYVQLFDDTDYRGTKCEKTEGVTDEDEKPVMFWHRTNNGNEEWRQKWAYNKFKYYGDANGAKQGHTYPSYPIMRSAEMLLIKAEAEANLGNSSALASLNTLQSARNSKLTTVTEKSALLEEIYKERRKELLGEGLTGMYDLTRLNKDLVRYGATKENPALHFGRGMTYLDGYNGADAQPRAVMPANDYRWFCQIPQAEFANNTAINQSSQQNPPRGQ